MTDNQNREVSGAIIGSVMVEFLIAGLAGIMNFEIAVQQRAIAAFGAFAAPALGQGGPQRAFLRCDLGAVCHAR